MNKFMSTVTIAVVMFLTVGCCGDANAAPDPKLSVNSVAQAGFDNLSADQQAQILQSITAAQTKETDIADKVDKWVNIGERVGKMLGGAAKELGIAANEFVKTDVGRMTAILVVWNYMGNDLVNIFVHVGGGLLVMVLGLISVYVVVRKMYAPKLVYDTNVKNWRGKHPILSSTPAARSDEAPFLITVACFLVIGVGAAIMLNV